MKALLSLGSPHFWLYYLTLYAECSWSTICLMLDLSYLSICFTLSCRCFWIIEAVLKLEELLYLLSFPICGLLRCEIVSSLLVVWAYFLIIKPLNFFFLMTGLLFFLVRLRVGSRKPRWLRLQCDFLLHPFFKIFLWTAALSLLRWRLSYFWFEC